jgi:hypothetical protein
MATLELNLTDLTLASLAIQTALIQDLAADPQFGQERMQRVFEAAHHHLSNTTAALGHADVEKLLGILWSQFQPTPAPPLN